MSNWWETPTQWALWCTDTSSATNYLYPNSYIDGQILAAMPTGTYTPSWPGSSSTSEVPLTIVKSGSIYMTFNGSDSTSKTSTAQVTSTATNGSLNMTSNAAGLDFNTSGIVGIAVGSSFALVAMIAFITFLIRSYRRNKARDVAQEPQFQNQLPRGTLGGAVLPGTWLDKDGEDDRATDGLLLTSNQNQNTLISDRNTTAGNNPELAETTVPEYTRELANSQISMSSSAKGRVSGSVNGFQPYKPPYSPMDIHRPAAPYSNAQASHSEPTVTSYNRSRPTSEIFGRVDSPSWTQYGSAYDQQNRVSAQAMSSGPQAISPVTASVSVHSTDQLILQNHSGCLISPMSTSYLNSTPSSPREIHDSARDVLRTGLIQSAFNTPSANNSLLPPSLLSSLPATPTTSVNQNFSNVAPERISSLLTELHSGQLSGSVSAMEDGLSARGDWKGWVSPESALAEGLWQSEVERMHEDDRELNGMEKSEEKKI